MHFTDITLIWAVGCWKNLLEALLLCGIPAVLAWLAAKTNFAPIIGELEQKNGELNGQLNSSRAELASSTASFKTKVSNLETAEIGLKANIESLQYEKNDLFSKIKAHTGEIAALGASVAALTSERDSLSAKWNTSQAEAESLRKKANDWEIERKNFQSTIAAKDADLQNWAKKEAEWKSNSTKLETERAGLQSEIGAAKNEVSSLKSLQTAWATEKNNLQSSLASKDSELQEFAKKDANWTVIYQKLEGEKSQLQGQSGNFEKELADWKAREQAWNAERGQLANQLSTKDKDLQNWAQKEAEWSASSRQFSEKLEARDRELGEWKLKVSGFEGEKSQSGQKIAQLERDLAAAHGRADAWAREKAEWENRQKSWHADREKARADFENGQKNWLAERDRIHFEWENLQKNWNADRSRLDLRIAELEGQLANNRNIHYFGKAFRFDDLKIVEGIGPKIEEIFHNANIRTWKSLSQTPVERLRDILAAAGERFKLADPTTWARQAELANNEDWDSLRKLQDELNGGSNRERTTRPSLKEELAALRGQVKNLGGKPIKRSMIGGRIRISAENFAKAEKRIWGKGYKLDDHTIVEGIGEKIDEILRKAGILTWEQLAATSPERIREILDAAGPHFRVADPATWPEQARLAYEEKFEELKKWQDELDGGRN